MTQSLVTNCIGADSGGGSMRGVAAWLLMVILGIACFAIFSEAPRSISTISPQTVALRIDPNTASHAELTLLPGIGPKLADAIIAYRESAAVHPAFRNETDLDRVPRIGPSILARSREMLIFPGSVQVHAEPQP